MIQRLEKVKTELEMLRRDNNPDACYKSDTSQSGQDSEEIVQSEKSYLKTILSMF